MEPMYLVLARLLEKQVERAREAHANGEPIHWETMEETLDAMIKEIPNQ